MAWAHFIVLGLGLLFGAPSRHAENENDEPRETPESIVAPGRVDAFTGTPTRIPGFDYPDAGSRAARKLVARLDKLESQVRTTAYSHRMRIDRKAGHYAWDCSAMVNWLLKRSAPKAYAAIDRERPVAISYVRVIKAAPRHKARKGWRQLRHIEELRPGDIFAWKRPKDFTSSNTGHVGFALSAARPVTGVPGAYAVRVVDASSYTHKDDTREASGPGGYGAGTIVFMTDEKGQATAYGWYGNTTRTLETQIVFGRVTG